MTHCQRCDGKGCSVCDPMPGDVLSVPDPHPLGVAEKRTVDSRISDGMADYLRWSGYLRETSKSYVCSLKRWRKWASSAIIVKAVPR